jgi:hypothetical protein
LVIRHEAFAKATTEQQSVSAHRLDAPASPYSLLAGAAPIIAPLRQEARLMAALVIRNCLPRCAELHLPYE